MMENWKDLLAFNLAERRGVWLLIVLIAVATAVNIYLMNTSSAPDEVTIERLAIQAEKQLRDSPTWGNGEPKPYTSKNRKDSLFFFDPNTATPAQWELLGLSTRQAAAICRYTSGGSRFRSPADLKKSFVISEDFFRKVEPWIRIKSQNQESMVSKTYGDQTKRSKINLNMADTTELKTLKGIGSTFAKRIVNFRTALGGFHSLSQLKEVFGLPPEVLDQNASRLFANPNEIVTIPFAQKTAKELTAHPYISPKLAYLLVELSRSNGIHSEQDLRNALPPGTIVPENLWPYLTYQKK